MNDEVTEVSLVPNPLTTTLNCSCDALMILYSKHHKAENMEKCLLLFTLEIQTGSYAFTMFVIAIVLADIPDSVPS